MRGKQSNKGDKNTGYHWDLVDTDKIDQGEFSSFGKAQMGNYDTRHEALQMKVMMENRFDVEYDQIRWHNTMWEECDEPVVCGYCGFEDWYSPQVKWTYSEEGAFCSTECYARYRRDK